MRAVGLQTRLEARAGDTDAPRNVFLQSRRREKQGIPADRSVWWPSTFAGATKLGYGVSFVEVG